MEESMAMFKGRTSDAQCPILGATFWKKGIKIEGKVNRTFETANGTCFEISLKTPVKVNGALEKKVGLGGMKGLHMALNASGVENFEIGDAVIIECTGSTPTNKGNPRVDFNVAVNRPDVPF
jgi:hypothetical protein